VAAGGAAAATEAWIRAGGGMAVLVGPRLAGRRGVALAGAGSVAGLAERRTGGGGVIGEVRMEHPLFAPFRAAPAAIGAPRFTRYARVEPAVGTDVLARFDDGSPAVLERPLDEGRILVLTTGLDVREGDFPLQPAFLPFLRRVVLHGSGHAATPLWRATGESWLPRGVRREPVVAAPDGTLLRPEAGEGAPAVILVQVGVYAAYEGRVDGAPRALVAVNPPTRESDLTGADDAELLLGVGTVADSTIGGITAPTAIEVESRQRAWRLLVLLALALLVGESLLASRGWRGKARRASVVSTGEGPA
jgi:hypothetical protein